MGRATIVSNLGEGLYTIRVEYNMTALVAELAKLNDAETQYSALILKALNTLSLLQDDARVTRNAMNAILQQWIDGIIAAGQEEPEPIEPDDPNDPETGLPWVDPDRAQEAPLLALINAARTAASVGTVSRDNDLDAACLAHLRYQGSDLSMGHTGQGGSKPSDRATQEGYYRPEIIHELLAYGETSPAEVMSRWQYEPTIWADLLAADVTHAGVSHVYASKHPGSYLWAVLLASAKGLPVTVTYPDDPADTAAEDAKAGLDAIKAPSLDDANPEKMGEAVRLFALAQNKLIAAEREVARLMAERLARLERIDVLETLQQTMETPIHAWACQYESTLEVGATVKTAEVPGYWRSDELVQKESTFGVRNDPDFQYIDYQVVYIERPINLIPPDGESGQLRHSETMSAAAIFVNAALEPGHLKWKPVWRYGTITVLSGDSCNITLEGIASRKLSSLPAEPDMALDEILTLTAVPISYPPCNGEAFTVGDEVLILFEGYDRNNPKVIGFRREPKPCVGGRFSWGQVI
jgi:uncharacterized protein YkwD